MPHPVRVLPEVAAALADGRPVVALESSVLAQGLPIPHNREAAECMLDAVRRTGATPAVTAVVRGVPTAGLTDDELARFLARDGVRKVSSRDIPAAMAAGADGATTVAASQCIARLAGIDVFATGGIGGVHRRLHHSDPVDESADLLELARTPVIVVCAGAKSILDLPATWERLETLGVPVVGYRTGELPGFYTRDTGIALDTRAEDPQTVAAIWAAHRSLGRSQALLVVQPPPSRAALSRDEVDRAIDAALAAASQAGVRGAAVTPMLLARVALETGGRSLGANLALLEENAALAAAIAVQVTARRSAAPDASRSGPAPPRRVRTSH